MPKESHTFTRKSIRIPGYDYSQAGAYFITLVTHERRCLFGEIVEEEMRLVEMGKIIHREWERLPKRFPGLELDEFIVMPNHFHGIIVVTDMRSGTGIDETAYSEPLHPRAPTGERFGAPVTGSVPTIIRSFKASVTLRYNLIRKTNNPLWQRNYYEHVIRNDQDLDRVRKYILANPLNWLEDQEYQIGIH